MLVLYSSANLNEMKNKNYKQPLDRTEYSITISEVHTTTISTGGNVFFLFLQQLLNNYTHTTDSLQANTVSFQFEMYFNSFICYFITRRSEMTNNVNKKKQINMYSRQRKWKIWQTKSRIVVCYGVINSLKT